MDALIVQTNSGLVRGKRSVFNEHLKCICFLGIPYAQPPLGSLRFQAPLPVEPWSGVLNTTELQNDCVQFDEWTKECIGSEDCLYLNIYIPEVKPQANIPVLILVSAWGFGSAKCSFYDPEYFIAENIIVVTFSFRIGPLGFLSACEPSAPGNAGLKDVLTVLRWIKANIAQFGGDPENITVFGSSGGSVIVNYLMLSKAAHGLFHKAVAQSGSILNPWAFTPDPLVMTCQMADILGYKKSDHYTVTEFLKSVPAQSLITSCVEMRKRKEARFYMVPFWPCLENEYEGQEAFLRKTPEQLLKTNNFMDIPYLTGFNRDEGFLFLVYDNALDNACSPEESLETFAAWTLNLDNKSYASASITKKLSSFYLNSSPSSNKYKKKYSEVLTDFAIVESMNRFIKATTAKSRKAPFYYYMFEFFGPHTAISRELRDELEAVNHHDELAYLFKCFWDTSKNTEDCTLVRKRMVSMWSNFIKFGDPTPNQNELLPIKWEPVTDPKELKFLKISKDLSMEVNPFEERMKFWESIHNDVKASRGQRYIDRQNNLGGIIK